MVGVLIFIVILALLVLSKLHFLWRGFSLVVHGINYRYRRDLMFSLVVSLDTKFESSCEFKKESFIDRIFKKLKFSQEYQTGCEEFDSKVYIKSRNEAVCRGILSNKNVRQAISKLIELESIFGDNISNITVSNGIISARLRNTKHSNTKVIAKRIGNHLAIINAELEGLTLCGYEEKDPYYYWQAIIIAFINSLFLYSIISSMRNDVDWFPWIIDRSALIQDSLEYTILLLIPFAALSLKLFKNTPYGHIVLLRLATVGFLGLWGVFAAEMYRLNVEGSQQNYQTFVTNVVSKKILRGNKGTISYKIKLKDWQRNSGTVEINVSKSQYDSVWRGMGMKLVQGEGHLGYPLIQSIKSIGFPNKSYE